MPLAPPLVYACVGALALAAALLAVALRRRRAPDPSLVGALRLAIDRTAQRYARAASRRGEYYFARGKLSGDPATAAIASLGRLGAVLDLGCGRGQLSVLLLELGAAARVRGVDWDPAKVALAARAAEGLAAEFATADVRAEEGEPADTVLLIDVIHYFARAEQDALLRSAAARVAPRGRLLLREADLGRGLRSLVTRGFEGIGTALRVNRGERVVFRDVERELVPILAEAGLACEVTPCWAGTPFSNVLLVASRPPEAGAKGELAPLAPGAARAI